MPAIPKPTVRVVSNEHADHGGFKVINEEDFDPEVHTKFKGPLPAAVTGTQTSDGGPRDEFDDMDAPALREFLKTAGVKYSNAAKEETLRELAKKAAAGELTE